MSRLQWANLQSTYILKRLSFKTEKILISLPLSHYRFLYHSHIHCYVNMTSNILSVILDHHCWTGGCLIFFPLGPITFDLVLCCSCVHLHVLSYSCAFLSRLSNIASHSSALPSFFIVYTRSLTFHYKLLNLTKKWQFFISFFYF